MNTHSKQSEYDSPLQITYGFNCPYHCFHQSSVVLAAKPNGNKIISQNVCTSPRPYSDEPVIVTRLYGNLRVIQDHIQGGNK